MSDTGLRGLIKRLKQKVPTEDHKVEAIMRRMLADGDLTIGTGSYGTPKIHVWRDDDGRNVGGKVHIGAYVSIAGKVELFTGGNHDGHRTTTYPLRQMLGLAAHGDGHPLTRGDVVVGNDVWLAEGCMVLSGVTIGDGAIVGARAVVSRDVRPYAVMAGNPARELHRRFSDDVVDALLALQWWNQSPEWVRRNADLLCAPPDLDALRAAVAAG